MPLSPRHSRNSSTGDSFRASPQAQRLSRPSLHDISKSSFTSSIGQQDTLDLSILAEGQVDGMGNLADELADAFSESGEEDHDDESQEGSGVQVAVETRDKTTNVNDHFTSESTRAPGSGLGVPPTPRRTHHRKGSEYDGSEYGSESDLDSAGMQPTLVAKIDAIESLARRGTESYGGPADDVFKRVTDGLRDLGSQSTVEGSASRRTRQLHSLAFPLLSPLVASPDAEAIDALLPLLISLSETMPRPCTSAFNSLTALHSITSELIQTLSYLSDTLHMSRQTTATASRRLKSAKDLVIEIKRDDELREEGERWLSRGNWGERLEKRECAGVCGDVIGGFEDVCNGWRQRLLAQAESQA
ncbi:hypothetical protein CP532_0696 [Ophiocordyceps camponoti-leonardi (nom. inval.)]|nr:hypothetical protein CP532_0696 [Ophiocordyceps camponoti-leonardi (nom. inval.)]